jgi:hypothetical protein
LALGLDFGAPGKALNIGTHMFDPCKVGLGFDYPIHVSSAARRYRYQDGWQTPARLFSLIGEPKTEKHN